MTRTKLNVLIFVFVLAAALLPQALFAQTYTVCADEADPQSCTVRHAERPAATQTSARYGAGDVEHSVTVGAIGLGKAQADSGHHTPSGGYGPHYAEQ